MQVDLNSPQAVPANSYFPGDPSWLDICLKQYRLGLGDKSYSYVRIR